MATLGLPFQESFTHYYPSLHLHHSMIHYQQQFQHPQIQNQVSSFHPSIYSASSLYNSAFAPVDTGYNHAHAAQQTPAPSLGPRSWSMDSTSSSSSDKTAYSTFSAQSSYTVQTSIPPQSRLPSITEFKSGSCPIFPELNVPDFPRKLPSIAVMVPELQALPTEATFQSRALGSPFHPDAYWQTPTQHPPASHNQFFTPPPPAIPAHTLSYPHSLSYSSYQPLCSQSNFKRSFSEMSTDDVFHIDPCLFSSISDIAPISLEPKVPEKISETITMDFEEEANALFFSGVYVNYDFIVRHLAQECDDHPGFNIDWNQPIQQIQISDDDIVRWCLIDFFKRDLKLYDRRFDTSPLIHDLPENRLEVSMEFGLSRKGLKKRAKLDLTLLKPSSSKLKRDEILITLSRLLSEIFMNHKKAYLGKKRKRFSSRPQWGLGCDNELSIIDLDFTMVTV